MKKIALLFIMIFAVAQSAPLALAVFTEVHSVFIAEEEKGEEKTNSETKEKKFETDFGFLSAELSRRQCTAFHVAENILPHPTKEKITPPPNFC
jgi:hypothetical protein